MNQTVVIFDLDGTLTKPCLLFDDIRAEIGVSGPILEAMKHMDDTRRRRAEIILARHEEEAAEQSELYDGVQVVLDACRRGGLALAILTRNSRRALDTVMAKFGLGVDTVRTRDDGAIKPSAEPILSICRELGADPGRSWMVGDYLFDLQSGAAAGTRTVLMLGERPRPDFADQADFVIRSLIELLPIIGISDDSRTE